MSTVSATIGESSSVTPPHQGGRAPRRSRGRRQARPTTPVISSAGRRATWTVGALRLGSAIATGVTLVFVAHLITDPEPSRIVGAAIGALVAGGFAVAEGALGGRWARAEERRLRHWLLATRLELAARFSAVLDDPSPAELITAATDNAERVTEYRQGYLGSTIAALAIPMVTLLAVAVVIDPVVGFGVLVLVPLIPLLLGGFMHFFRKTSAASRNERARLSGRYLDAIRNLVTIRLLGAGPRIEHDLRAQGEANRGAIMKLLAGNQLVIIVMDGLFALVLICVTAALAVARADHLSPADIVAIMLLTVLLLEPLQQVAGFFYIGMGGIASHKALRRHVTSMTAAGTIPPTAESDEGADTPVRDDLAIQMQAVVHDHGRGPVLRGVDLEVPPGGRVVIIGPSGAGKSTLLGLLRGTLVPTSGLVAVAGQAVRPDTIASIRSRVATVAQSTWMFTGTVAENLRIARDDATDEELWDALRRAQVADDVAQMPHGLNTPLGEGAVLISGGQAQRLSLARALVSGRSILLLDEPTSQVDVASEALIIDAIAALPRDLTIVMVTHRHRLLELVDTVYEVVDGRLYAREAAGV